MERVSSQQEHANAPVRVIILVSNSSVSSIFGKVGNLLQRLMEETGCRIKRSRWYTWMKESFITIVGTQTVAEAVISICKTLQKDGRFEQHLNLEYDVEIPMAENSFQPGHLLLHTEEAAILSRVKLRDYILQADPQDLLRRRLMLGKKNFHRVKRSALLEAVQEIWVCRGGKGPCQS
ncbi:unnamed protein product [Polarella glacialis]|uniref:K Homology domain-containing protein n=1 Tax=Polarella glacialis TaxID=89957 RepID=A0A813H5Y6_POLGL|nr:unnamed protein product [Polarella glacialis]